MNRLKLGSLIINKEKNSKLLLVSKTNGSYFDTSDEDYKKLLEWFDNTHTIKIYTHRLDDHYTIFDDDIRSVIKDHINTNEDSEYCQALRNAKVTCELVKKHLTYYNVVRNFKGSDVERFKQVVEFLNSVDRSQEPHKLVNKLLKVFKKSGFGSTNISAATKLLYCLKPDAIFILDSNAINALKLLYKNPDKLKFTSEYEHYLKAWQATYVLYEAQISKICQEFDDAPDPKRVFDKLLWEIGLL